MPSALPANCGERPVARYSSLRTVHSVRDFAEGEPLKDTHLDHGSQFRVDLREVHQQIFDLQQSLPALLRNIGVDWLFGQVCGFASDLMRVEASFFSCG
jgi:hypothetical protein